MSVETQREGSCAGGSANELLSLSPRDEAAGSKHQCDLLRGTLITSTMPFPSSSLEERRLTLYPSF